MVIPTAVYESETWTNIKNHETRLQLAEMKLLLGVARYTCSRSPVNYKDQKKLKIFILHIKIQNYRNNWLQYLQGTEGHRI